MKYNLIWYWLLNPDSWIPKTKTSYLTIEITTVAFNRACGYREAQDRNLRGERDDNGEYA